TGGALYFGVFAGHDVAASHWWASWTALVFVGLHLVLHARIGGTAQLLRIFRPERLPPPPPRLDPVELLTMLVDRAPPQTAESPPPATASQAAPRPEARAAGSVEPQNRRHPTLQSNPFVVAAAVAIVGASAMVATDWLVVDSLKVHRIVSADAPVLDGD